MFEIKNKESLKSRHGEVCREGILTVSPCWLNWRINPRKDSLTHIVSKGEDWRLTDWLTDYWLTDDWLTQPSKYSETGLTQMVRNGKIRLTDYVTEGMVRQDWLTQLTRLMWNSDTRLTDWTDWLTVWCWGLWRQDWEDWGTQLVSGGDTEAGHHLTLSCMTCPARSDHHNNLRLLLISLTRIYLVI